MKKPKASLEELLRRRRAYTKAWRYRNLPAAQAAEREVKRQWNLSHPEEHRRRVKEWRTANPEKESQKTRRRRALKTKAVGFFTDAEWKALCAQYDFLCLCCGEEKPLTQDHIIPLSKGGSDTIDNIQPLCKPCNSRKGAKTTDYRFTAEQRNSLGSTAQ